MPRRKAQDRANSWLNAYAWTIIAVGIFCKQTHLSKNGSRSEYTCAYLYASVFVEQTLWPFGERGKVDGRSLLGRDTQVESHSSARRIPPAISPDVWNVKKQTCANYHIGQQAIYSDSAESLCARHEWPLTGTSERLELPTSLDAGPHPR